MFGSTAGLWGYSLSSRRELSGGLTAMGEHRCGAVSLQCIQLPNTSCGHWDHGNVLQAQPEALPPSPDSHLADAWLGLCLAR